MTTHQAKRMRKGVRILRAASSVAARRRFFVTTKSTWIDEVLDDLSKTKEALEVDRRQGIVFLEKCQHVAQVIETEQMTVLLGEQGLKLEVDRRLHLSNLLRQIQENTHPVIELIEATDKKLEAIEARRREVAQLQRDVRVELDEVIARQDEIDEALTRYRLWLALYELTSGRGMTGDLVQRLVEVESTYDPRGGDLAVKYEDNEVVRDLVYGPGRGDLGLRVDLDAFEAYTKNASSIVRRFAPVENLDRIVEKSRGW